MKKVLFLILTVVFTESYAQTTISAYTSTKGIGPIPSFIIDEPAATVFASIPITKNFVFEPDYASSLSGRPWFSDLWFRYSIMLDTGKKWVIKAGIDPSLFFQKTATGLQTIGYPTVEGNLRYNMNAHSTFIFDYQYLWAVPKRYGTKITYLSLSYTGSIESKKIIFTAVPNLFHLDSPGDTGIAGSLDLSLTHKKSGFIIGFQMVQAISLPPVSVRGLYLGYSHGF